MLSYVESGIIRHLLTATLPEADICPLNLGGNERQLRVSDLYTTYAIIITGFCVAFIIFCSEIVSNNLKKRKITAKNKSKTSSILTEKLDYVKKKNKVSTIIHEGSLTYVNGREYITLKNPQEKLKLIPTRGLSAFLFDKSKF